MNARSLLLAATAGGAAATHVLAVLAAGALTPESYPLSHAISELGMTGKPHAVLAAVGGMIVPGILAALSALIIAASFPVSRAARLGLVAMAGAGASLTVAGMVPYPAVTHLVAAIGAASACAAALALFSPWAAARLGGRIWATTGLACAAFLTLDAFAWVLAEGLKRPPHAFMGLEQRAASCVAFAWWGLCGIALARRLPGEPHSHRGEPIASRGRP